MPERLAIPEREGARVEVDVEGLFRFLKDLTESHAYADRTLETFAETDPKNRALLGIPQSPNYHAEGPVVADHYRLLLVSIDLFRRGRLDAETVKAFVPIEGFENEWNEVVTAIQRRPALLEAFVLEHDIGKTDTVGFYYNNPKKRGSPKFVQKKAFRNEFRSEIRKREQRLAEYRQLYKEFADQHPGLKDERLSKAFYDAYEINVSYFGHEEALRLPDNRRAQREIEDRLGLTKNERRLVQLLIQSDGEIRERFKDSAKSILPFLNYVSKRGMQWEETFAFVSAAIVLDLVLASKKFGEDGSWKSETVSTLNFWRAARALSEEQIREANARASKVV